MLQASRLRFVPTAGVSDAKVTLDGLAVEGTKQVRPDAIRSLRSSTKDFAFGEEGRRGNRFRRDRTLEGAHPANV